MSASRPFITFRLAGHAFGVEVQAVQEVLRAQPMTRVPLAAPMVTGLINLRGQIVTAIDLRRRLELPERPPGASVMNVIVRSQADAVSLLVDEIGEVIDLDAERFERAPETVSAAAREIISGVCKLPGRLLLVLDCERAVFSDQARPQGANASPLVT